MGAFKTQDIAKTKPLSPITLHDLQNEALHLFCWCNRCGHNAELAIDPFITKLGLHFPVPEIGRHMKCSQCQANDIATRPAWPRHGGQLARHS